MAAANHVNAGTTWTGDENAAIQRNWNGYSNETYDGTVTMEPQQDWSGEVRYPDVPQMAPVTRMPPVTQPVQNMQMGNSQWHHISYQELRGEDTGAAGSGLDMTNPQTQQERENPMSNAQVYHGSMKSLLERNLGYYVLATFQMGNQATVAVPGILYTVGNDYIVLYQPEHGRYVTGDLYALKFVEFHDTQSAPRRSYVPANQ